MDGATIDAEKDPMGAECVRRVLERQRVPRDRQSTEVAKALGLSYSQAHRKLMGASAWTLTQLSEVGRHFGMTLHEVLDEAEAAESVRGTLLLGGLRLPCAMWIAPMTTMSPGAPLVALMSGSGEWTAVPSSTVTDVGSSHEVRRLVVQVARGAVARIAVVDDDGDSAEGVCAYLRGAGLDAHAFTSVSSAQAKIEDAPFDGYVIDWLLGGETAGRLIRQIREHDDSCPVIVLTGQVATGRADEDSLAAAVETFRLDYFEKPVRLPIIRAALGRKLAKN